MTPAQQSFSRFLFEIEAIKFGEFRLKLHESDPKAPLSPIYIDLRVIRSFPHVLDAAVEVYEELTECLRFDYIADIPTAVTPIVAVLSHSTRIPMISPRVDNKSYGSGRQVDGSFRKGSTVLLLDDLITAAHSKLEAIRVLEENELVVRDVVTLIDRGQGGAAQLQKRGYQLHAAFDLISLLAFLEEDRLITQSNLDKVLAYLRGDIV